MKDTLPPEHFEYMRQAVREGKAISVKHEAQIMLLILGRNLLPALLQEAKGEVILDPEGNVVSKDIKFRSDVSDRLKVWTSLLNINAQLEKRDDERADNKTQPIFEVVARRGINAGRLRLLVGVESGDLDGDADGTGRPSISVGTVPDQLAERQIDVSDSEQVEATWHVADDIGGDDSLSTSEEELQR
jgi:hypothetical protein